MLDRKLFESGTKKDDSIRQGRILSALTDSSAHRELTRYFDRRSNASPSPTQ
jgi:hypothetical protein